MPELTLLFQYGSNMDRGRLLSQIERFAPQYAPTGLAVELSLLGAASLPGWRFIADLYGAGSSHRVADIVEEETATVWGALYELPVELVSRYDCKRSVLDRIEGHRTVKDPENYRPHNVTVDLRGEAREARTYVGLDEARRRCAAEHPDASVSEDYRDYVLGGATEVGLPQAYVAELAVALVD
jgi:hypothetical protein